MRCLQQFLCVQEWRAITVDDENAPEWEERSKRALDELTDQAGKLACFALLLC